MFIRVVELLRQSFRVLWREPGFTAHAALILALGIGATSAVFSLIHGVLLTPPPYAEPERIVLVSPRATEGRPALQQSAWSAIQWEDWQGSAGSFDAIAAYGWTFNFLVLEDGSESQQGMWVTHRYFDVTGLKPVLGRPFSATDEEGAESQTILLGYDLWQRQFQGDPDIVGKSVRLSRSVPLTVIGVMPPGIRFLPVPGVVGEPNYDVNAKVDYWLPIMHDVPAWRRGTPGWNVVARLRSGVTPSDAAAELAVIAARQAEETPALAGITASVEPLTSVLNTDGRRILLPLLAAAALVLLISCGNAAALLLVRGLQRQHEYGVRGAIGANRAVLFRHVITESLLLAVVGGAVGIVLGIGIVEIFKALAGRAIPRLDAVAVGWPILSFGLGAALIACALAGLYPAWRASRLDPVDALRDSAAKSTAGRGQRRVLGGVLVVQMALTLALLAGAGLLTRTMYNLDAVQSGYDTSQVVTMSVTAVDGDWADFHERALERVAALPGVEGAAFAWGVPLTGNAWPNALEVEGYSAADRTDGRVAIPVRAVTPGYFALLRQTIEEGRDFRSADRLPPRPADANAEVDATSIPFVAVVNRAFVERYLGGENALGKKVWQQAGSNRVPIEIVGVVSNSRTDDLARAAEPELYMPLWQAQAFSKHLVVRTTADPAAITAAVRRELRMLLPTAAVENVQTLEQIRGQSLASRTFAMQLLIGFAVVACVLTLGGVYSVLSLSVAARRREIAIRCAAGAERSAIVALILRDGLGLVAAGTIGGLAIALVLGRVLQTMLFGVGVADPAALGGAALTFIVVALLACCLPAVRAARVDPAEALKSE